VAEENDTLTESDFGEFEYWDSFPEDQVDPKLVVEFFSWAHEQPPLAPLSTWRPPLGHDENITDNSFGAITSKCPRGCHRSRSGHCVPIYTHENQGTRTYQKRGRDACSIRSGATPGSLLFEFLSISFSLLSVIIN